MLVNISLQALVISVHLIHHLKLHLHLGCDNTEERDCTAQRTP
jgi:hypothetical protein